MMDRGFDLVCRVIGRENCGEQIALVRKSKTACAWHVCTRLWLMFRIGEEYKRGHTVTENYDTDRRGEIQ